MARIALESLALSRNGVPLRDAIRIDDAVLSRELDKFARYTVVRQSLSPNSTALRNATVDVTLAVTGRLPVVVLPGVPELWQKFTIDDVADRVRGNPEILKLMAEHPDATTLTPGDREKVVSFLST